MVWINSKYLVLEPRGDNQYARASRAAIYAYADAIREVEPELADTLEYWADNEDPELKSEANSAE